MYDLDGTVNIDHSSSDVVDILLISPDITAVADNSFSYSMSYSGNFSHVQLAFQLTCGPAQYGTDCSVYCVETNDTTGHFTCDPATGDRLCLEGYSDPLTNCIQGPSKQMISMYMLYYGGEWSTGYTRVVSFDRARGRSPSGLSKLTTSVNRVDHKHSAIV